MREMKVNVYIAGEDPVTRAVILKLLNFCSSDFHVLQELPARGSEIKNKISNFNILAEKTPIILLTDLDTEDCAPVLKKKLLEGIVQNKDFVVNIAVDEAEAWLLADCENFANYLGITLADMPVASKQKQGGMKALIEMSLPVKASYYLTHALAPKSSKIEIRNQIASEGKMCKSKEYNIAVVPFIQQQWDIAMAMQNSDSLCRMVKRLKDLRNRMG